MADPKFANLPGIVSIIGVELARQARNPSSFQAYDQPDVYETADNIPEQETSDYYEEELENEHIERLHISTKDAYNRFKGKYLTGYVDFSDRIGRKSRPGYDAV